MGAIEADEEQTIGKISILSKFLEVDFYFGQKGGLMKNNALR